MIKQLRKIARRILRGKEIDSETRLNELRKMGMRIGERTMLFGNTSIMIDTTRPWLIEIGSDVQITHGVTILTHGYDWSVLKRVHGELLGSAGKVTIGNNVFIGVNSTILKGVTIGSNVIIGANSLVSRDIPDNCVAAGNPAKAIMTLDEYYAKRKAAQESEARELVREYRKVYGRDPGENELAEFFWLFTDDPDHLPDLWDHKLGLVGNKEVCAKALAANQKKYKDMQDFLNHC